MNKKTLIAAAVAMLGTAPAWASSATVYGLTLDLDNHFSAGGAWRMQSRDMRLVGIGNGGSAYSTNNDDGDLAFDRGDMVSAAAKLTSDLTISRGAFGLFVRGSYLYNQKLRDYDFFNINNYYATASSSTLGVGLTPTGRASVAPVSEYHAKNRAVGNFVGNDADLLDAYLYGSVDIGRQSLTFKLGRQVLNWGESTLVQNGINSLLAFDANQLRVPGYEISEVITPQNMIWLSTSLSSRVAVEGFYEFDWQRTQPDAPGTFWSTNDFAGVGGTRAFITFGLPPENTPNTTIPRGADHKPGNSGQFGGKISIQIPALNDMDLSFYAMQYHSRLPLVSGVSKSSYASTSETGLYFLEYPKDIQLYGVSFNTTLGDWSAQGEYSYKPNQPLQVDDVELLLAGVGLPSQVTPPPAAPLGSALGNKYIRGYRRHEVSQVDTSFTRLFGPMRYLGSDQLLFVAEAAADYVHDLPPTSELRYDAPGTYTPGSASVAALVSSATLPIFGRSVPQQQRGYATAFSWGYKLIARLTYNNLIGPVRIEPALRFDHDVHGVTPTPMGNFVEGRKMANVSVTGYYQQAWSLQLGYSNYFGGGQANLLSDRDYLEAALKYVF
ncbi:Protein of unknown function [Solimonas aquatica]|uniref:DUF1302 domain-containing protein n=1 Tax=Solimonas aquatica TaxID=489703 RepID=A0A1H9CQ98_9GAMM|nr:DUF1302 domain-containing protein [Solimonas aquatica]SEQ03271.1 Protein of unknown function [Solimonas aquatica]